MAEGWREIGYLFDAEGCRVGVMVREGVVSILTEITPTRFGKDEREKFIRLYMEAERQAEAWQREHAAVSDG